jgi:hypothetical protein
MRVIAGDLVDEGGVGNLADPAVQAELDKKAGQLLTGGCTDRRLLMNFGVP